jgi:aspartate kinase
MSERSSHPVLKFGGTSVADAAAISRLIDIVQVAVRTAGCPPVVVVSAMSGVTDRLLALTATAQRGEGTAAVAGVDEIGRRHDQAARELVDAEQLPLLLKAFDGHLNDLRAILGAVATLGEASGRSLDVIAAAGELLSSHLVAAALDRAGIASAWIDARQTIVTTGAHTSAAPLMAETRAAIARTIVPHLDAGRVPVVGGFVGATPDGVTTTLGRGGSDFSAAIIGAALDSPEVQIWTDVDGMLTADPRVFEAPRLVPQLSFGEAFELAYFGAKVLHPNTILPAVERNIPVRILNSRRPAGAGTLISAEGRPGGAPLAAIACKRRQTVVDITSTRMLMAHGFLRRLFEVFERHATSIDVVTTSEVSVSVTIDDDRRLDDIVSALREFAEVAIEPDMAILCAVGDALSADPRLAVRALSALAEFPLRMVSQAASRRNLTVVLRDSDLPAATAKLHETLFARSGAADRQPSLTGAD